MDCKSKLVLLLLCKAFFCLSQSFNEIATDNAEEGVEETVS